MRTINTYNIPKETQFTLLLPRDATIITILSYEQGFGMEYKLLTDEPCDGSPVERYFISIPNHTVFDPEGDEYILVGSYTVRRQPWVVYEIRKADHYDHDVTYHSADDIVDYHPDDAMDRSVDNSSDNTAGHSIDHLIHDHINHPDDNPPDRLPDPLTNHPKRKGGRPRKVIL